jgi:hypothetical protein
MRPARTASQSWPCISSFDCWETISSRASSALLPMHASSCNASCVFDGQAAQLAYQKVHHIVGITLGANTFLANVRHWRDTNIGEIDGPEIGHSNTRKPRFELLRRYSGSGLPAVSGTKNGTISPRT